MSAADGSLGAAEDAANIPVTTFREAEVLGLRYMQEGNYEQALNGTKCWLKLELLANEIRWKYPKRHFC